MSPRKRRDASDADAAADAPDVEGDATVEAPEPPAAKAPGRRGDGFTRKADPAESTDGGLHALEQSQAQKAISETLARTAVRAGVVKVPQFAPPVMERPEALKREEERRSKISERERKRRARVLAELEDPHQKERLLEQWQEEDDLVYRAAPEDREIEIYPIREPFTFVQIVQNARTHEMLYHVIEPILDREERILLDFIEETLIDVLDMKPAELHGDDVEAYIEKKFEEVLRDYSIVLGESEEEEEVPDELLEEAQAAQSAVHAAKKAAQEGDAQGGADADPKLLKQRQKEAAAHRKEVEKRIKQKRKELEKAALLAQKEAKKAAEARKAEEKRAEKAAKKAAKGAEEETATEETATEETGTADETTGEVPGEAEADPDGANGLPEEEDLGPLLPEDPEEASRARLLYYVMRDFIGEGPLDVLMKDPMIEDISCDGPHVPVFVYHRKYEALTTTIKFQDDARLDSFVIRLAQRAGKHVSIAEPILDATMRDGSRIQATLSHEVSSFGSTFTIRKFRDIPFTPIDLIRFGTMSPEMLAYLWMVIEHHMSAIYAGGTASGKTTSINAIMTFIPPQNKVVTIEDTREIQIPQPNWIAGITRGGFGPRDAGGRQAGEIDMFQLLKNALRQRPEYIIVGEVRGAEAYSLFQAMATGHAAYGTMHADSVDAVIHRLESDPINIPRSLLEALDVVAVQVQTRVAGKRVRRTKQITEIVGLDPNTREILTNEVFHWVPGTDSFDYSGVSYALERIAAEGGIEPAEVIEETQQRAALITAMMDNDIHEYRTVAHIITTYYKDRERVIVAMEKDDWESLLQDMQETAPPEPIPLIGGVDETPPTPEEGGIEGNAGAGPGPIPEGTEATEPATSTAIEPPARDAAAEERPADDLETDETTTDDVEAEEK